MNLVRFATLEVRELRTGVRSLARADLGSFEVEQIEVVRTDEVLSAAGTTVLGRIPLGRA